MSTPMCTHVHPVGQPIEADELLVVITLEPAPIRRLLIIDITGDPTYCTLEPQLLDGPAGDLLVLLAYRHDGYVELYVPRGRAVDPTDCTGLGKGLHGRSFVPARRTGVDVRVDRQERNIAHLPHPLGGRRCLMARYDPDVQVCQLNPDTVRVPTRVPARATSGPGRSHSKPTAPPNCRALRAHPHRGPRQPRDRQLRAVADTHTPPVARRAGPAADLPPLADDLPLAGHPEPACDRAGPFASRWSRSRQHDDGPPYG